MEPFSIHTTSTLSDWKAYAHAWALRTRDTRSSTTGLLLFSACVLATVMIIAGLLTLHVNVQFAPLMGGVVLGTAVVFARLAWQKRTALPDHDGCILGPCHFEFNADGFRVRRPGIEGFVHWSRVRELDATSEHVFLWLDRISGHLIPLRDLPEGMSKDEVVRRLRSLVAQTPQPSPSQLQWTSSESVDSVTPAATPSWEGLAAPASTVPQRWGVVLGRLWTLRSLRGDLPVPGDFAIGVIAVVSLWLRMRWMLLVVGMLFAGVLANFFSHGIFAQSSSAVT